MASAPQIAPRMPVHAQSSAAFCVNFDDPNAVTPKRICLEGCTLGTPAQGEVKCHDRLDEVCDDTSQTCQPWCATDADCGTRKCSAFGMCKDTARTGSPLGSPCMTIWTPRVREGCARPSRTACREGLLCTGSAQASASSARKRRVIGDGLP